MCTTISHWLDRLSSWPVTPQASALQDSVLGRVHGQQAAPATTAGLGTAPAELTARPGECRTVRLGSESYSARPRHLIYLQIDCPAYSVNYSLEQCIEVKGLPEKQCFRMEWLGLEGNQRSTSSKPFRKEGTLKALQFSMNWRGICYKRQFFKSASSSYKGLKSAENVFLWKTIWEILLL